MPDSAARIYLDACVFLSYIDGDEDRVPIIDELFRRGGAREIELVTSVLAETEVAFSSLEKTIGRLDGETETKISGLWAPSSPIAVVEFYESIALHARNLVRAAMSREWSLKPMDAIHLATAVQMEASAFYTYDRRLDKYAAEVDFAITEPQNPQDQLPGTQVDR